MPVVLNIPRTYSPTSRRQKCVFVSLFSRLTLTPLQVRWQPKLGYMLKQPDINASMRSVLVDWLVEVVDEFSLQTRTLYLAVSLIDRFLSCMSVLRGKLQLVGSTAMYIAAKLEEIYPPELSDFAYITDNTYTRQQVSIDPNPLIVCMTSRLHY